jgi:hypothetical protein
MAAKPVANTEYIAFLAIIMFGYLRTSNTNGRRLIQLVQLLYHKQLPAYHPHVFKAHVVI